jgi:hypothetical protein
LIPWLRTTQQSKTISFFGPKTLAFAIAEAASFSIAKHSVACIFHA